MKLKVKTVSVAKVGLQLGRMIFPMIVISRAPSIRADSLSSAGTFIMAVLIIKVLKALNSCSRIIAV